MGRLEKTVIYLQLNYAFFALTSLIKLNLIVIAKFPIVVTSVIDNTGNTSNITY
jgi:hypothetical protein